MSTSTAVLPRRDLRSFTAVNEKRALLWLAARVPAGMGPDHLTGLGLFGSALAGLGYALGTLDARFLLVVQVAIVLNWLGDSLDGTVARYRKRERPRYGFYVDHVVDAYGALALLGGLALSPWMSAPVAVALALAYLLLQVEIALGAASLGVFRMAFAGVGGTELRIVLLTLNSALLIAPQATILGFSALDVLGTLAAITLTVTGLVEATRTGRALNAQESAR